jgi:predicted  nucleic acid-binding Zn-ribbon protein
MEFLGLIFALVAIFMARTMRKQLDAIAARLDASERVQSDLKQEVAVLRGGPAPEAKTEEAAEDVSAIEPPEEAVEAAQDRIEDSAVPPITPAEEGPRAGAPQTSLEERLGTRWAVWVGDAAQLELDQLRERRENAAVRLDPQSRRLYDRVRGGLSRMVLAPLTSEGACGNCFNVLPVQEQTEVRRGETLRRCEGCGVILYSE